MKLIHLYGLGYDRDEMPQIEPHLVGHFLAWLKEHCGAKHSQVFMVSADCIRPTQDTVNAERVESKKKEILESDFRKASKTIILSLGGRQLDGHNTVEALKSINPKYKVPVVQVEMFMDKLIEHAKKYPYVSYKSIKDVK